jgi:hypothetical protein
VPLDSGAYALPVAETLVFLLAFVLFMIGLWAWSGQRGIKNAPSQGASDNKSES